MAIVKIKKGVYKNTKTGATGAKETVRTPDAPKPGDVVSAGGKNIRYGSPAHERAVASGAEIGGKIYGTARPSNQRNIIQTTTAARQQARENGVRLDNRLTQGAATAAQPSSVSVTRDLDNGDGTRTVEYSDGTRARVTATKNDDGSETYKEVTDLTAAPASGGEAAPPADPFNISGKVSEIQRKGQQRIKEITGTLDRIALQSNAATNNLIRGIKQTFQGRIQSMQDSNKRLMAAKEQMGIREGRSRYASVLQAGILTGEEIEGIGRIAELEGEMFTLIAQAEQARAKDQLTAFNTRMNMLDDIEDRMQTEIQNLYKNMLDFERERREREKFELEKEQKSLEMQLDRSERSAPALAKRISEFSTADEKAAFVREYARLSGIDEDILLSDIEVAADEDQKRTLDMENVRNAMKNRDSQTAISAKNAATSAWNASISNQRLNLERQRYAFDPSDAQREEVGKYLSKFGTDEDSAKAASDPDFFWFILDKAQNEI